MSKFYEGEFYREGRECQFEPDQVEIPCEECGKPSGQFGTCTDRIWCAACRADFEELVGKEEVATVMVAMASGEYHYKPIKRVLHFAGEDGTPICRHFQNAQSVTTNPRDTNCKQCVSRLAQIRNRDDWKQGVRR